MLACIKQGRPLSTCLNVYRRDGSLVWLQVLALAPERALARARERERARALSFAPSTPPSARRTHARAASVRVETFSHSLSLHSLSTLFTRIFSLCLSPHPLSLLTPSPSEKVRMEHAEVTREETEAVKVQLLSLFDVSSMMSRILANRCVCVSVSVSVRVSVCMLSTVSLSNHHPCQSVCV